MKRFCARALLKKNGISLFHLIYRKVIHNFFYQFVDTSTALRFMGVRIIFFFEMFLLGQFSMSSQFTECLIRFFLPLTNKNRNQNIFDQKHLLEQMVVRVFFQEILFPQDELLNGLILDKYFLFITAIMMGSFKASLINMTAKVTRCNVFIYNLHSSLLAFSQYGRGHSHGLIRTTIVKKSRKAPVRVYSCSKVSCSKFFQINYFSENVFPSFHFHLTLLQNR